MHCLSSPVSNEDQVVIAGRPSPIAMKSSHLKTRFPEQGFNGRTIVLLLVVDFHCLPVEITALSETDYSPGDPGKTFRPVDGNEPVATLNELLTFRVLRRALQQQVKHKTSPRGENMTDI